jgi:hypothetical protein
VSFLRWGPTVVGFPLGGWAAILLVGPVYDTLSGALAGAVAGTVIGGLQWLALGRRADWRWMVGTILGMSLGIALAAAVTDAGTAVAVLALTALVSGALVGAAQSISQGWNARSVAVWIAVVSISWAAGWTISANVITDVDRGYVTFGLSGSAVVTLATGFALQWILRASSPGKDSKDTSKDTDLAADQRVDVDGGSTQVVTGGNR